MPKDFSPRADLPEHLDLAQAEVFTEPTPRLGGRLLVWGSEIWWHRPDGLYQLSIHQLGDLDGRLWAKVS